MQAKERDQWGNVRARGMLKFVLLNGVAMYGLSMFVVMTFVVNHNNKLPVAISAAIWLSAGAAYGIVMWLVQERRYRKAISHT